MKKAILLGVLFGITCLTVTSCVSGNSSSKSNVPFTCFLQSEKTVSVPYEIYIDDKLVGSGSTELSNGLTMSRLAATPGDHVLLVTAPGYEKWEKKVTILDGIVNDKGQQSFKVIFQKSEKQIPNK